MPTKPRTAIAAAPMPHRANGRRTLAPSKDPGDLQALSKSFSAARASSGRSAGSSERHRAHSACSARSAVDDVDAAEALETPEALRAERFSGRLPKKISWSTTPSDQTSERVVAGSPSRTSG